MTRLPTKLQNLIEHSQRADRARFARRQALFPEANTQTPYPEHDMNPLSLIESIETNRAVMEAQVKRLQHTGGVSAAHAEANSFEALVQGALFNAGATLQDLYQTEQQVRQLRATGNVASEATVIDSEAQVADSGGAS